MYISKVIIKNYRGLQDFEVELFQTTLIIGENETGKSSFFSALSLPLSTNEIHFSKKRLGVSDINIAAIKLFYEAVINKEPDETLKEKIPCVSVEIELCSPEAEYEEAMLRKWLKPGGDGATYSIKYEFSPKNSDDFIAAVKEILKDEVIEEVRWFTLPTELYDYRIISPNNGKQIAYSDLKSLTINVIGAERDDFSANSSMKTNNLLTRILVNTLGDEEKANINKSYVDFFKAIEETETFKQVIQFDTGFENFSSHIDDIECIPNLPDLRNILSNITLQVGDEFLYQRGLGERNLIYLIMLFQFYKLDKENFNICCIEEPEAHLSVNNLRPITDFIYKSSKQEDGTLLQILISSHNPSVVNKLELSNVVVFSGDKAIPLKSCSNTLQDYLRKRPNFDVLKLLFANKIILVEGPTEEMLINTFLQKKEDSLNNVEILVTGKGYTTFLELWLKINKDNKDKKIGIIRDFDNQPKAKVNHDKYDNENDNICVRTTVQYTLEDDFVAVEGNTEHLAKLHALGENSSNSDVSEYMKSAKTEEMLKLCDAILRDENPLDISLPPHTQEVIDFME